MMHLLIALSTEGTAPAIGSSLAAKIGIGIGLAVVIMLVPALVAWLKKQKIVQKYHLETSIDKYSDRLVHYLEDLQRDKGVTGVEAMQIGINKVKSRFGLVDTDAEEAMRAAYTKGKRVKDAVEKAAANANLPEPPEGGS